MCSQFFLCQAPKHFYREGEAPSTSSMARTLSTASMARIGFDALQLQRFQRDAVACAGNGNAAHLPLGVFSRAKYLFTLACAALAVLLLYIISSSGFGDWCKIPQSCRRINYIGTALLECLHLQHVGLLHLQPCNAICPGRTVVAHARTFYTHVCAYYNFMFRHA